MIKITCPYCGHNQSEPEECYQEDELYTVECDRCNKIYGITPYYIKGYIESKMPCANGEPHNYQKLHTSREGEWEYCEYCGVERQKLDN